MSLIDHGGSENEDHWSNNPRFAAGIESRLNQNTASIETEMRKTMDEEFAKAPSQEPDWWVNTKYGTAFKHHWSVYESPAYQDGELVPVFGKPHAAPSQEPVGELAFGNGGWYFRNVRLGQYDYKKAPIPLYAAPPDAAAQIAELESRLKVWIDACDERNKKIATLNAELKEINAALDDPRTDLTMTASEVIAQLQARIKELEAPSQEPVANIKDGIKRFFINPENGMIVETQRGNWIRYVDAAAQIAELGRQRTHWEEEAKRYCKNSDYWREQHNQLQARIAELEAPSQEPVAVRFPQALRKMWSGGEVQAWLDREGPFYTTPPDAASEIEKINAYIAQLQAENAILDFRATEHAAMNDRQAAHIAQLQAERDNWFDEAKHHCTKSDQQFMQITQLTAAARMALNKCRKASEQLSRLGYSANHADEAITALRDALGEVK